MYREMFSHHFPSPSAKKTVPSQGKSIACSTAAAIAWDASFENLLDPSGRAVGGVHDQVLLPCPAIGPKLFWTDSKILCCTVVPRRYAKGKSEDEGR